MFGFFKNKIKESKRKDKIKEAITIISYNSECTIEYAARRQRMLDNALNYTGFYDPDNNSMIIHMLMNEIENLENQIISNGETLNSLEEAAKYLKQY